MRYLTRLGSTNRLLITSLSTLMGLCVPQLALAVDYQLSPTVSIHADKDNGGYTNVYTTRTSADKASNNVVRDSNGNPGGISEATRLRIEAEIRNGGSLK